MIQAYVTIKTILEKLDSNAYPDRTYVGKNYTKADLIQELGLVQQHVKDQLDQLS